MLYQGCPILCVYSIIFRVTPMNRGMIPVRARISDIPLIE